MPPASMAPPLRRSASDRVLGGVCAGVARHFGIDPLIVRIAVVVLALMGGAGLLLYLIALVLIPDEGTYVPDSGRLLDRLRGSDSQGVLILLGVIGAVLLLGGLSTPFALGWWRGPGSGGLFGLLIVLVVIAVVARRDRRRPPSPPPGYAPGAYPYASPPSWGPPAPGTAPAFGSPEASTTPSPTYESDQMATPATPSTEPDTTASGSSSAGGPGSGDQPTIAYGPPPGYGQQAGYEQSTGYAYGGYGGYPYNSAPTPTPVAPRPPRETSYLGAITLSLTLLVGGALAALTVSGAIDLPVVVLLASCLAILGAGLVVGAFAGRAKWLIALAVPLLLVTQAAALVPNGISVNGGVGDRRWAPVAVAAAEQGFRLGIGDARLDLTRVTPAPTADAPAAAVRVSVGTGSLRVIVPNDARVNLRARVGLGELTIAGMPNEDGSSMDTTTTLQPLTGSTPTITFDLDAEVGLGNLEVVREIA